MSGVVTFALWDLETGNLVGAYDSEEAALAVVRRCITDYGQGSVEALGLARESRGRTRSIAAGAALATRALAASTEATGPAMPPVQPVSRPAALRA